MCGEGSVKKRLLVPWFVCCTLLVRESLHRSHLCVLQRNEHPSTSFLHSPRPCVATFQPSIKSIHPSIHPSTHPSIHPCIHPSIHPSIHAIHFIHRPSVNQSSLFAFIREVGGALTYLFSVRWCRLHPCQPSLIAPLCLPHKPERHCMIDGARALTSEMRND